MNLRAILRRPKVLLPRYPDGPGIYIITDEKDRILYVGSSKQLSRRVSHLTALQKDRTNKAGYSHIKAANVRNAQKNGKIYVIFQETASEKEAKFLEKQLIREAKGIWNERGA